MAFRNSDGFQVEMFTFASGYDSNACSGALPLGKKQPVPRLFLLSPNAGNFSPNMTISLLCRLLRNWVTRMREKNGAEGRIWPCFLLSGKFSWLVIIKPCCCLWTNVGFVTSARQRERNAGIRQWLVPVQRHWEWMCSQRYEVSAYPLRSSPSVTRR